MQTAFWAVSSIVSIKVWFKPDNNHEVKQCPAYNWEYLGHNKKEGCKEEVWKSLSSKA